MPPATFASCARRPGVGLAELAIALAAEFRPVEGTFSWRCPHQAMRSLSSEVLDRSRRGGDLSAALRAAELQLALPLHRHAHKAMRRELAGLRAALN
jgi:hypothetical protein